MMNDRFSAQLRQHLLTTADERPGDGRLKAIVEGVAVTRQSHPLLGRLPWAPRRTELFPSAAARYGLIAAAVIIAIVAAALAAGVGPTRPTDFEGTWQSTDPGDGSRQTLVVGGGTSPALHFQDDFASGAACANSDVKVFTMDGTGSIDGDRLEVVWPNGGGCGLVSIVIGPGSYLYDDVSDTITDGQGLTWTRLQSGLAPPSGPPTTRPAVMPAPPSAPPTPHPGEARFTSTIHGFSMGLPPGWAARPATEPWGGEPLDFDSPAADILFDPALADGLYVVVASQTFSQMSEDQWMSNVLEWTCPESRGELWSWQVDGVYTWQIGPCDSGSLIPTDTRGYLIRLVASEKAGIADDREWVKAVLETVDLRAEDAVDPPSAGAPVPKCTQVAAGAGYANRFSAPKLSATVPEGAEGDWYGYRDAFALDLGGCRAGEPIRIDAAVVDAVIDNACEPWTRSPVAFGSLAEAAEVIAAQPGHSTSGPTEVTIAGHAGLRLEISTEGSTCTDGIGLWYTNEFAIDDDAIVYLVDLEGKTVAITVWYPRSAATPAQLAEAEAIVASIKIEG